MSKYLTLIAVFTLLALLFSCGKKINKQNLTADEYFEYAKKKFDDGDYYDAVTEFNIIVLKFSGNPVVDDAQYYLAESHFKQKEYLIAISEYEKLVRDYPTSPYVVLAQFKIGMSYYEMSLRPELDQEYTQKGIRAFQVFIEEHPNHELRESADKFILELREKLARKKMIAATTYQKMGECASAVIYFNIILDEYYDTPQAVRALFLKGECLYELEDYVEAQTTFRTFIEKYPKHPLKRRAEKRFDKISEMLAEQQSASE
jgi:outer membrane protein assembly factor BamD